MNKSKSKEIPVYGTARYFYRFCKDVLFANENLARLSNSLVNPSRPSLPMNLKTINRDLIHESADKPIHLQELQG